MKNQTMDPVQTIPVLGGTSLLDGFYEPEKDLLGKFAWAKRTFRLGPPRRSAFLSIKLCYYGQNGRLCLKQRGQIVDQIRLYPGWQRYPLNLAGIDADELDFELNGITPVEGDHRELGVMIRRIEPFDDYSTYQLLNEVLANKQLNHQEFLLGKTVLQSYPPELRIDIESRCNIKPICVYCEWHWAKAAEEQTAFQFTYDTLAKMGSFYQLADGVTDCSCGEPLLNRDFGRLVEKFDEAGKFFEATSNGQLLDRRNRQKILGRNMVLYISVDSATPDGYARYRNHGFGRVIRNLRNLCREKAAHQNLPIVLVSFIAMKSNCREFDDFLGQMSEIGVNGVKLRSLYSLEDLDDQVFVRNGYRFDYRAEMLALPELEAFTSQARRAARQKGVHFIAELDLGKGDSAAGSPICSEPWKTIYVLRRGLMPCCFAKKPLTQWSPGPGQNLQESLEQAFNSPEYQQLRANLAQGKLPEFCLECKSCPITKRKTQGG